MISQITGIVQKLTGTHVVLDLHGFGLKCAATPQTLTDLRIGQTATLATTLVVREDSLTLYGFSHEDDRNLFELAQTASGVGPKVALAIVSVFAAAEFARVVRAGQHQALTKVPGIGPKGAQRIVLELKDKVAQLGVGAEPDSPSNTGEQSWREQVAAGLEGLGWSAKDAQVACDKVAPLAADPEVSVAVLMRQALRTLAKV